MNTNVHEENFSGGAPPLFVTTAKDKIVRRSVHALSFEFRHSFVIRHSCFAAYKPPEAEIAGLCLRGFVIIDRYEAVRVNLPMQLRRLSIALAVLIMCAGFLPGQTRAGSETGIEGVITISPTRPGPVPADAPSSQPLANTAFVVENQKGEVTSFTTDDQGRFRMPLTPGHYKVSLKGKRGGIGHYGPFQVDVVAGQITKVQWECDSGIR
jgi:hypothetical protein